jgi:hypothetical protein
MSANIYGTRCKKYYFLLVCRYIENVDIKILSGGKLYVKNKGSIKKYKQIYTAPAATVRITNGVIN